MGRPEIHLRPAVRVRLRHHASVRAVGGALARHELARAATCSRCSPTRPARPCSSPFSAALSIALVSLTLGSVAAFRRGWVDGFVSHLSDAMVLLPAMLAVFVLGIGRSNDEFGAVQLGLSFGILYGLGPATATVRAAAMTVVARPFMDAARVAGGGGCWIVSRHVLPHLYAHAAVQAMIGATGAVIADAFLSFRSAVGEDVGFGQMVYDGLVWSELMAGITETPWWIMLAGAGRHHPAGRRLLPAWRRPARGARPAVTRAQTSRLEPRGLRIACRYTRGVPLVNPTADRGRRDQDQVRHRWLARRHRRGLHVPQRSSLRARRGRVPPPDRRARIVASWSATTGGSRASISPVPASRCSPRTTSAPSRRPRPSRPRSAASSPASSTRAPGSSSPPATTRGRTTASRSRPIPAAPPLRRCWRPSRPPWTRTPRTSCRPVATTTMPSTAGLVETFDPYPRFRDQLASDRRPRAHQGRGATGAGREPVHGSGAGWYTRLIGDGRLDRARAPHRAEPVLRWRQPGADPPQRRRVAGGDPALGRRHRDRVRRRRRPGRDGDRGGGLRQPAPGLRPAVLVPARSSRPDRPGRLHGDDHEHGEAAGRDLRHAGLRDRGRLQVRRAEDDGDECRHRRRGVRRLRIRDAHPRARWLGVGPLPPRPVADEGQEGVRGPRRASGPGRTVALQPDRHPLRQGGLRGGQVRHAGAPGRRGARPSWPDSPSSSGSSSTRRTGSSSTAPTARGC